MPFNIFDVEPVTSNHPAFKMRTDAFAKWMDALPDKPGTIVLTYGLLDTIPYSYEYHEAPAGDIVEVTVNITDLFRTTTLWTGEDQLTHPDAAKLADTPGFWKYGLQEAVMAGGTMIVPMIQAQVVGAGFDLVGWSSEKWMERCEGTVVSRSQAVDYVMDRALVLFLCGPDSTDVHGPDSTISMIAGQGLLSDDDIDWLQLVVSNTSARMRQIESLVDGN